MIKEVNWVKGECNTYLGMEEVYIRKRLFWILKLKISYCEKEREREGALKVDDNLLGTIELISDGIPAELTPW